MTTETTPPETQLWTQTGFLPDEWAHGEDASALAGNSRVILPLAAYLALDDATRDAAGDRLGVLLAPADPVDAIAPFLPRLALVALAFPAFSDGRSFSKAELLRRRHGYEGIVRASGDVLIDQIPHMLRTGFDQFEVSNPTALARLGAGRIGGIEQHYQPSARSEAKGAGYSWRRVGAFGGS